MRMLMHVLDYGTVANGDHIVNGRGGTHHGCCWSSVKSPTDKNSAIQSANCELLKKKKIIKKKGWKLAGSRR